MRTLKIHFCWALVAMGSAGAWGRWSESPRETVALDRERKPDRQAPRSSEQVSASTPLEGAIPAVRPVSVTLPADFHLLPDPNDVSIDEIRQLIPSKEIRDAHRALSAVQHLKDQALKRELLLELMKSPHDQIRELVMNRLAREFPEVAVPILQEMLRTDRQPTLRAMAAVYLGDLPDRGSLELLLATYHDDEDSTLKIAAAAALYKLGHPGEATETMNRLAADFDNPDDAVRRFAVEQIGRLRAPIALPVLARALRDSSGDVRSEAVMAIGEIDAPEIVPLLEPLLKDPLGGVRDSAKDAIDNYQERHPK